MANQSNCGNPFGRFEAAMSRVRTRAINEKRARLAENIQRDLRELASTWEDVQETRKRSAIYAYLRRVYQLVRHWKRRGRIETLLRHAYLFAGEKGQANDEPFAALVRSTAQVDAKT